MSPAWSVGAGRVALIVFACVARPGLLGFWLRLVLQRFDAAFDVRIAMFYIHNVPISMLSYLLDKTSIEDGYLVSKLPRVCCSWVYILLFEL